MNETNVPERKKRRMLPIILGVIAAIVVLFLIIVALQPADYQVQRGATIAAPAPDVFAQVNDLRKFQDWSPWAKLDPDVKNTYEGPPAGTGAITRWVGNKKVGEGNMTIVESHPSSLIKMKLEFIKPFPSTADVQFDFKPEGNATAVTWTMSGKKNFMSKAFCLFMNMDKMVGGDFERGLANLKALTEKNSK
jgi:Polyketide cyclase / dehydrase and lipid transport